ncbi:orotate phosphoribosyltransferase [Fictibacillus sp. 5RED26]|jgi:orotate phosphoribosyltransferase|uniref:orotate phosphoribosyltransferase n=1 Tax=Fictibacillus sp. 5RED26 TaxID=2745876 RepID=UPI0018CF2318|nr:orotate phosphoribosyltransferase [Fictibacillus sp. 5RED26]MBH0155819.1 orotate phosphoribosyltransferase [Fictibacillus sp. 5RED26]
MKTTTSQHLLNIEAVTLSPENPYTWSSGMKSPIYCDNRLIIAYPEIRKQVAGELSALIEKHYPEADLIAGTATAGIPHAAFVADQMELPMCYVRSSAKAHGKTNQIEGLTNKSKKAVVVEDLISTGKSSIQSVLALREAGIEVLGVVAIFSYGLQKADVELGELDISFQTVTNFSTLIEEAQESGKINEQGLSLLKEWQQDPEHWGAASFSK